MLMAEDGVAGLDVSERSVSAVRLRRKSKGHWEVRNAGVMELVQDATDQEVARVIHTLWRQHQLSCTSVCYGQRSPTLLVRHFRYPFLTDAELRSTLRLAVEEEFQLPVEQYYLDWHLFRQPGRPVSQPREDQVEGFFVAVPKRDAQRQLGLLAAAGLQPVILDVRSTALANLFLAFHGDGQTGEAVGLVNLQDHCVDLALLGDNRFLHARSIYSPTRVWEQDWDRLVDNIRNELKYFEFKLSQASVRKLVLVGPILRARELREHLQEALALPVEQWDPRREPGFHVTRAARAAWQDDAHLPLSVISIGLAMRING
jgi:Tfp pilus assembly PilM family ATPase